jgi:phosphoglycolate phosphatase-like HAD superfamily hydrolase
MNAFAQAALEEYKALEARIGGIKTRTHYEYRGEEWDSTLQRVPATSRLWRVFRPFDEARKAAEAAEETLKEWKHELRAIGHRMEAAANDPRAVDDTTYATLLGAETKYLRAIERFQPQVEERKRRAEQEENRWVQTWQGYQSLLREIRHAERNGEPLTTFDGKPHGLLDLRERRRAYEEA